MMGYRYWGASLFILGLSLNAHAGGRLSVKAGNPIYILEQSLNSAKRSAHLIEFRPTGSDGSCSRLLLSNAEVIAKSFGLAGFQINDQSIMPGTLVVLDEKGRLWVSKIDLKQGPSLQNLKALETEERLSLLEHEAEKEIVAVTESQNLLRVDEKGKTNLIASRADLGLGQGEKIAELRRGVEGASSINERPTGMPCRSIWLLTNAGRVLHLDVASRVAIEMAVNISATAIYPTAEALWVVNSKRHELVRYPFIEEGEAGVQSASLQSMYQSGVQDGQVIEFMGSDNEHVYVRIGARLYDFSAPIAGKTLSSGIIENEIFGKELRSAGVLSLLHTKILALQPRDADRSHKARSDLVHSSASIYSNLLTGKTFNDSSQKWWMDSKGVVWSREALNGEFTFEDAKKACKNMGARLPRMQEYIDAKESDIKKTLGITEKDRFWTSTFFPNETTYVQVFSGSYDNIGRTFIGNKKRVRCVAL